MASFLLFVTAAAVLLFTLAAPTPLPGGKGASQAPRAVHHVRFRHTLGLVGWLVRFFPYEARQVTREDMQRQVQDLIRGVDPRVATDRLVRAVFVRRWWHVGVLAPERQFRQLALPAIPTLLEALMHTPPTRRG